MFDKIKEFSGIVWNSFWSPKNKYIKWTTRIVVIIMIAACIFSVFVYPKQVQHKSLQFDSQYAFTDPGQNYFSKQYSKAVKDAKELKSMKNQTSPEYLQKENNIILTKMAENPDTNVTSPGQMVENELLNLNKDKITDNERNWFKETVALTAGQTGYVYTTDLLKTVGIDKSNYTVGFDMYSGNLYIDPKVAKNYPEKEKLIKERAQEIWDSSTLSKRLPNGLKIHFLQPENN